jgi:hypothetical protein
VNNTNKWLDLAFEAMGKSSRPEPVERMPLGIFAQQCDRARDELGIVPAPSDNAQKGLRLVRGLLFRAANIARGMDADPTEHLRLAAMHLTEDEARDVLSAIYRCGRER